MDAVICDPPRLLLAALYLTTQANKIKRFYTKGHLQLST